MDSDIIAFLEGIGGFCIRLHPGQLCITDFNFNCCSVDAIEGKEDRDGSGAQPPPQWRKSLPRLGKPKT